MQDVITDKVFYLETCSHPVLFSFARLKPAARVSNNTTLFLPS